MSDDDGLPGDMHRLLGFLEAASPVADQDTVERLLAGRLDPADAPAGCAGLARLLAAATAPAAAEELAGEHAALAEFAAVVQSHPTTPVPRRAAMPSKLLSVKAAAAVLAAVLSVGGVAAAATGLLPGQAQRAAQAPTGRGRAPRPPASRHRPPRSRRPAAARRPTPAREGTGRAAPQPPPAEDLVGCRADVVSSCAFSAA